MDGKSKDFEQEKRLIEKYSPGSGTKNEQFIETIISFFDMVKGSTESLDAILDKTLKTIKSFFKFNECAIGLRDSDGLYRFKAMIGFRNEAVAARKEIFYSLDDMKDIFSYRPINICRFAQFHLSERKPYKPGTEVTYNHPELLESTRNQPNDMIEGDYIEFIIYGKDRDILGWLELSGPESGRIPSRETILKLEFFTSCIVPIIFPLM